MKIQETKNTKLKTQNPKPPRTSHLCSQKTKNISKTHERKNFPDNKKKIKTKHRKTKMSTATASMKKKTSNNVPPSPSLTNDTPTVVKKEEKTQGSTPTTSVTNNKENKKEEKHEIKVKIEPGSTKRKAMALSSGRRATKYKAKTFNFAKHAIIGDMQAGKMKTAKLESVSGGPLIIEFNGGGFIPVSFGCKKNQYGKLVMSANVEEKAEYDNMTRAKADVVDAVIKNRESWFQGATISDALIAELVSGIVGDPRPKKDGNGKWPGSISGNVDINKLATADNPKAPVKLLDADGGFIRPEDLPGRHWSKIIIEVAMLCFGANKDTKFSKRVRLVKLAAGDEDYDVVVSSDEEEDATEEQGGGKRAKKK
jgi:hypothetical protein